MWDHTSTEHCYPITALEEALIPYDVFGQYEEQAFGFFIDWYRPGTMPKHGGYRTDFHGNPVIPQSTLTDLTEFIKTASTINPASREDLLNKIRDTANLPPITIESYIQQTSKQMTH